ncbi:MAG TPA: glycosyltransferase [Streptosporangiaceae bacterium]|nr:glycosyltransferase [Streptosporangiaceae bacterium]
MRIMVVTDQYAPMVGGVPTVTRTLALGLAQRGHTVALLAPSPGWRGRLDAEEQVRVHYRGSVPWPWYAGMRLARLAGPAARGLLSEFAPDVLHIHSPVTLGVMARLGAHQLGIPVVYTNHYLPANVVPSLQRRPRAFDALFYSYVVGFSNRCSHVTAPTATALRLLRDRGLRVPSRVISNGVDLRRYSPGPADERLRARYGLPRDRPVILSVGRLSPEKRVDVLLNAASRLRQDTCVVIAGTGPEEASLRARAARLGLTGRAGLTGRVRFLGFVPGPDLPGLYRLADIFAIASEAELQSLTTMEAMATGLPVVAARSYALAELVSHRHNGFLVPPGRGDQLAACLDLLGSDPGLRSAMAAQSLHIIGGHERHHWLAEWESLYGLLAATRGR